MCTPPGERRIDPGPGHTGYDSKWNRGETSTHKEQEQREKKQNDTTVLPLHKRCCPYYADQRNDESQDTRDEKVGNDGHSGFAAMPHLLRLEGSSIVVI